MAKYIGRPRRDLVIEPFAGSAGYSLYWKCRNVKLYDIDHDIVEMWDYLIYCSEEDIKRLPDWIDSPQQVLDLELQAEQNLITRWLSFGKRSPLTEDSSLSTYDEFRDFHRDGIPTNNKMPTQSASWSPNVKVRILRQKPLIANWTVELRDYKYIPNECAHWHIDPPYQSQMKVYDKSHVIDYYHLSEWCRTRQGSVDVCEQEGADWLEFKPIKRNINLKRSKYTEVIWRNERTELF